MLQEAIVRHHCPFRATRRINAIIRQLSGELGVALADVDARVQAASPDGITGSDLFIDHCHLNEIGNQIMLKAFAEQIVRCVSAEE